MELDCGGGGGELEEDVFRGTLCLDGATEKEGIRRRRWLINAAINFADGDL